MLIYGLDAALKFLQYADRIDDTHSQELLDHVIIQARDVACIHCIGRLWSIPGIP